MAFHCHDGRLVRAVEQPPIGRQQVQISSAVSVLQLIMIDLESPVKRDFGTLFPHIVFP